MSRDNLMYPVYYAPSSPPQDEMNEQNQSEISTNETNDAGSSYQIEEDRSCEDYWEKRKRFTLAFAAGLRKFVQMHPELLRYGPKKNQGGIPATVTSSVITEDEGLTESKTTQCGKCVACLKTEDCGKCAFCSDMTKFGGKNELQKRCIQRQCVQMPLKNTSTLKSNNLNLNEPTEDSTDVSSGRPIRAKAGVNNDSDFLFPVKEEYLDDEDEELLQRNTKRTRISSPRSKRARKPTRRSRNDDDVDYKPSHRSRRTNKQTQNVEEVTTIANIKTEIIDTAE